MFCSTLMLLIVDIKELKLLGGFNHPNIVRFVRVLSFDLRSQLSLIDSVSR